MGNQPTVPDKCSVAEPNELVAQLAPATSTVFHRNHGVNIRLNESDRVAVRADSCRNGVVFSSQAIPQGTMFEVQLLEIDDELYGSIVSS